MSFKFLGKEIEKPNVVCSDCKGYPTDQSIELECCKGALKEVRGEILALKRMCKLCAKQARKDGDRKAEYREEGTAFHLNKLVFLISKTLGERK